jgi:1-pyrroline-5-carboxylate dehydrogenase
MSRIPEPRNEPVRGYAPGSAERAELAAELEQQKRSPARISLRIGGEAVDCGPPRAFTSPHDHSLELGRHAVAGPEEVARAIDAALEARSAWAALGLAERASVFLRAAALLAGSWRQRLNAATMLNQSKTPHQAEIDAACELIDFFRFNAFFAQRLQDEQLLSPPGEWNQLELRPLDGFVYAVTPFNFTSIAGNLPSAPALMGNTVVWKPSPHAVLSGHYVMELLREAGLPPGVVNVVYGDAAAITHQVLEHPRFAGLHFTGSTAVLRELWRAVGDNIGRYGCYPRIVGESGGKDFVFAHASADVEQLAVAILRGGYEYQGQKCSAVSRAYVARSLWQELERRLREGIRAITLGDPTTDLSCFMGAVIGRHAYDRITSYQELARGDAACRIVAGGGAHDEKGFFVEPTLVETTDPRHRLMQEEIFGPFVTVFVYEDSRFEDALELCDQTSPYALTGGFFARDRGAVAIASERLRFSAGNFYLNDKPTGAVVGQQPFGGSRLSGTNDKAGSMLNLVRWVSPRTIKENLDPPRDWRYPYMGEEFNKEQGTRNKEPRTP